MAARDFDAIFFVSNVPDICFEDGVFRVSYDVGTRARFEFVLPPHIFMRTRRAGAKAITKFEGRGDVVPIRDDDEEAVAH